VSSQDGRKGYASGASGGGGPIVTAGTGGQDRPTMVAKNQQRRKEPLSAARIAAAALELIDSEGLDGFSFRALAKRLGCEAMSIYHYFPSKAHLFDTLVEICIGEVEFGLPEQGWLERLRRICHSLRAVALRHPGFFIHFVTHRLNNRAGLDYLNRILEIIAQSGLPIAARARHFRAIGYYVMGAGLDESRGYIKGPSAMAPIPDEIAVREFPAIMAVGPYFKQQYHEDTFAAGLETLLRELAREADAMENR